MVAKLMEYVHCIIEVLILLLFHTISFNDISISKKKSSFINCVLQLHRSPACVEAMISMKLSKV